jgi:hypothetical protein
MAKIMDANIIQVGHSSDPPPRFLQVDPVSARTLVSDHVRIAVEGQT